MRVLPWRKGDSRDYIFRLRPAASLQRWLAGIDSESHTWSIARVPPRAAIGKRSKSAPARFSSSGSLNSVFFSCRLSQQIQKAPPIATALSTSKCRPCVPVPANVNGVTCSTSSSWGRATCTPTGRSAPYCGAYAYTNNPCSHENAKAIPHSISCRCSLLPQLPLQMTYVSLYRFLPSAGALCAWTTPRLHAPLEAPRTLALTVIL
jgi:hypothetical protein